MSREPRIADLTPRELFEVVRRLSVWAAYARHYRPEQMNALLAENPDMEQAVAEADALVQRAYR